MAGKTTFIYALRDPRDRRIRYVGKANDPKFRLRCHMSNRNSLGQRDRGRWVSQLIESGHEPELVLLEEAPLRDWKIAEKKWIRRLRRKTDLLNTTRGGNGTDGRGRTRPLTIYLSDREKKELQKAVDEENVDRGQDLGLGPKLRTLALLWARGRKQISAGAITQ